MMSATLATTGRRLPLGRGPRARRRGAPSSSSTQPRENFVSRDAVPLVEGLPGARDGNVQRRPRLGVEVISFVIQHEIEHRAFGQAGGLIQLEPTVLDDCAKSAHAERVRQAQGRGTTPQDGGPCCTCISDLRQAAAGRRGAGHPADENGTIRLRARSAATDDRVGGGSSIRRIDRARSVARGVDVGLEVSSIPTITSPSAAESASGRPSPSVSRASAAAVTAPMSMLAPALALTLVLGCSVQTPPESAGPFAHHRDVPGRRS